MVSKSLCQIWLGQTSYGDILTAYIYWGLVIDPDNNALVVSFEQWHPYLAEKTVLSPPPEPVHVTLFYDREGDLVYQEWFNEISEGQEWVVSGPGLIQGLEGVATLVTLTPLQSQYCKMGPQSAPHMVVRQRT